MEKDQLTNEEAFGNVLRDVRLTKGLSQEELAYRSGLHRTYISILERGLKSPSLSTIFRLFSILEIKPQDFLSLVSDKLDSQINAG
jgi:transcriptional regulator with XRE-family HTH domain